MTKQKVYIAIDLKSFYASVECVERGLNPLTTNLVVADASRTEKTICLAVSPSLKQYGISGRARLFEVVQQVKEANKKRLFHAPKRRFTGKSCNSIELTQNQSLAIDYIAAPPQMAHYMAVSNKIYDIYLKHVAPEDIHNYSVDEVFIDATDYLRLYKTTPHDFAMKLIKEVLKNTGITATAGIGSNLYLAKVAMDIVAKHIPADEDGVRIAELDEQTYKEKLWDHRPITDFWRVGKGYANKLKEYCIYTMGDVARMQQVIEDLHEKGFSVAMDDFGSGYSSLNVLKNLYFDCVKLDKEFLSSGAENPRMKKIISGAVTMIKGLGSCVVAEGVETPEQAQFLQSIGCDLAQGYLFSRPLPVVDFEAFFENKNNK